MLLTGLLTRIITQFGHFSSDIFCKFCVKVLPSSSFINCKYICPMGLFRRIDNQDPSSGLIVKVS